MNLLFFIYIGLLHTLLVPTHQVPLAKFHIVKSNETINLDIIFDLEDFSESLDIHTTEVNLENMQKYLSENTSFQFNDQLLSLKLSEVKIIRDHIRVKGSFGETQKEITTIKIENTCLNNIAHHSNVIQIDLNNESKDFRMHKRRTIIDLKY